MWIYPDMTIFSKTHWLLWLLLCWPLSVSADLCPPNPKQRQTQIFSQDVCVQHIYTTLTHLLSPQSKRRSDRCRLSWCRSIDWRLPDLHPCEWTGQTHIFLISLNSPLDHLYYKDLVSPLMQTRKILINRSEGQILVIRAWPLQYQLCGLRFHVTSLHIFFFTSSFSSLKDRLFI